MDKNIIVVGYYDHGNIGDQQYKITFKILFGDKYKLKFVDCDKLKKEDINERDIIVFGGGDVLLEYFVKNLLKIVDPVKNKIYAVSVGVPYPSYIYKQDLSFFEHIYVRSHNDYKLLSRYYNNITYIPDISVLLKDIITVYCPKIKTNKKIIGVTAIQNCNFEEVLKIIENYPVSEYYYVFIPFNTNKLNLKENDNIIHDKIIGYMTEKMGLTIDNYANFKDTIDPLEIFRIVGQLNVYITARYHGCQFAKHNGVKFIPVHDSQKIKNFIKDIENENILDIVKFRENFENVSDKTNSVDLYINNLKKKLFKKEKEISTENDKNIVIKACSYLLTGKIESEYNYGLKEKLFNKDFNFNSEIKWILNDIDENMCERSEKIDCSIKNKTTPVKQDNKTETLKKNIRDIKHTEFIKKHNGKYFDMSFKNQNDDSGTHRSGWKYVYDSIYKYSSKNSDILLDMYIDETFHWYSDVYQFLEIIPYRKKWIGFIHHTFNTSFTDYNCVNLLKNKLFLESLKYCKCIIVLSEYLKNELIKELKSIGVCVDVFVVCHPTELNVPSFDYKKFIENKDGKILNVGSWYRNIYSFYSLNFTVSYKSNIFNMCTRSTITKGGVYNLSKTILAGKKSCNYFPNEHFLPDFKNFLCDSDGKNKEKSNDNKCSDNKCCDTIKNNWNLDFYNDTESKINSVKIISHLQNSEYDEMLTQNIVFCNLIDASAVNTLIECVARNTPIIISRLPAVVELLGVNYPLYIDNLTVVENTMYIPLDSIKKAHYMLCAADKYVLSIENFVENLLKIVINI